MEKLNNLKYESIPHLSEGQIEVEFASNDSRRIALALLSLSLFHSDIVYIQSKIIEYLESKDIVILVAAILAVGHVARIHRVIDEKRIVPLLHQVSSIRELAGYVSDVFDDIEIFVHSI